MLNEDKSKIDIYSIYTGNRIGVNALIINPKETAKRKVEDRINRKLTKLLTKEA